MAHRNAKGQEGLVEGRSSLARRRKEEEIARRLSREISLAGFLGRRALNPGGRRRAYQVKAAKLSVALISFSDFFRALSVEPLRPGLGPLLKVRLADFRVTRVPVRHLSAAARSRVNLPLSFTDGAAPQARGLLIGSGAVTPRVGPQRRVA
jgi:hypothetical protein